MRVGVPCTTGRQPSQNGQLHVFPGFPYSVIPRGLASRAQRDANPRRIDRCMFFPVSVILRGLASCCARDANPRGIGSCTFCRVWALCHSVRVGVPYCTGCQPSRNKQLGFRLSFCEGWRPVHSGTPTLTEWTVAWFPLFPLFCHSARVGVPFCSAIL